MSHERAEAVRAVYERWGRGDFEAGLELFDPEVEFVMPTGFPEAGTYRGLDRIAEYTRGFLDPWSRITIEAEELAQVGDEVVASVLQRGVGVESGAPTEFRYFQVWSFREGRVIRLENSRTDPIRPPR